MLRGAVPRFCCLLLMSAAGASGWQQVPAAADAERERDAYAIYSLMMTNPRTSHGPDNNQRYLIRAETGSGHPTPACVVPPPERASAFREVLADYERRGSAPKPLQREFTIPKPYVLASNEQVKAFQEERFLPRPGQSPGEQFRGVTDLFTLADVYFNPSRSLALTALASWCGSLCGLWEWRVFEKSAAGRWEERPWVTCTTIAALLPWGHAGSRPRAYWLKLLFSTESADRPLTHPLSAIPTSRAGLPQPAIFCGSTRLSMLRAGTLSELPPSCCRPRGLLLADDPHRAGFGRHARFTSGPAGLR